MFLMRCCSGLSAAEGVTVVVVALIVLFEDVVWCTAGVALAFCLSFFPLYMVGNLRMGAGATESFPLDILIVRSRRDEGRRIVD